ncbi:Eukaryotic translation initiation factor 3 subunit E [Zea mays]|uniref:Eukaryotic translation initiation factor 3 subunit E n=1 Tax=Zea mays TaxID=4577 RepID=A0A1D6Q506_MAIZE|nr:Eukaryotic translation initiation factor 3 subunit E [Zea mays]
MIGFMNVVCTNIWSNFIILELLLCPCFITHVGRSNATVRPSIQSTSTTLHPTCVWS